MRRVIEFLLNHEFYKTKVEISKPGHAGDFRLFHVFVGTDMSTLLRDNPAPMLYIRLFKKMVITLTNR